MVLSHKCMTATTLAPFLAPAAGTIAFILLLCVSIGAVLALNPFSAGERLTSPENHTPPFAWTDLPPAIDRGIETEDSTNSNRLTSKQASAELPEGFTREEKSPRDASWETSANSERDLRHDPIREPEPYAFAQPAVRWWGINE